MTLAFLLGVAGLLTAVKFMSLPPKLMSLASLPASKLASYLVIFLAAALLALEANALRVVLIAVGGEHRDGIQYATTALAVVQLVALARVAKR